MVLLPNKAASSSNLNCSAHCLPPELMCLDSDQLNQPVLVVSIYLP